MADLITNLDIPCIGDCGLSNGLEISCDYRTPGGNDNTIYIINKCNIDSYADNYTNGVVDEITLNPGAVWFAVQARLDTITWEETVNQQSGFYTQTLTFILDLIANAATKDEGAQMLLDFVQQISNPYNNFVAVLAHNGGFRRIFGLYEIRGLKNGAGTVGISGANFEETGGYTITLTAGSSRPAPVLSIDAPLPLV